MTSKEEKSCCACEGVGSALGWALFSNTLLIIATLIVLGFGEIWYGVVVVPTIVVLIFALIVQVVLIILVIRFVIKCLKTKY
ncbi:hypothetical protein WAK64_13260 [Bacillus spongiae]|uniref:Transmembrane protein n=1 Tax=Bacillus spongiae TaxID=2683610 RepID=A0ABU8HFT9_9BACI